MKRKTKGRKVFSVGMRVEIFCGRVFPGWQGIVLELASGNYIGVSLDRGPSGFVPDQPNYARVTIGCIKLLSK